MLDGKFAFILRDAKTGCVYAARDHMGICPLYIAYGHDGSVWFASEMKCFVREPRIARYEIFPPGHYYHGGPGTANALVRWYNPKWLDANLIPSTPADLSVLRATLINAVVKRLMADVPFGVLLSGGLDSSLVTAIAVRHGKSATNSLAWSEKVHSFSIGIRGAPDLIAARKVASFLGTDHHEFTFTPQEALDALPDVIYHLETFEQVRASVPMYLLARKIKAMGVKMVLSGEGADEAFGGYLYFHKAPSADEFHRECVRKTTRLHQWDVCRANKSTQAWGLEARVPFLDRDMLELAMNIDPKDKMIDVKDKPDGVHPRLEKYLLRKAFDDPVNPYLPAEVLWRQKEQFSDGVGYDWVDGLKAHAEEEVSDADFAKRAERFPFNPPETKEYYLLRSIFEEQYPEQSALDTVPFGKSIACSTPEALSWDPKWLTSTGDISGRAVDVHDASGGFTLEEAASKVPAAASAAGWDAPGRVRAAARGAAAGAGASSAAAAAGRMRRAAGLRVLRGLPRGAAAAAASAAQLPAAARGGRAGATRCVALAPRAAAFC
jgi:asparagine synthase (glutamine-hydrolysing)